MLTQWYIGKAPTAPSTTSTTTSTTSSGAGGGGQTGGVISIYRTPYWVVRNPSKING